MLTEAVALGDELGDTEIRAEAMAWRVPALVALCDLAARAPRDPPAPRGRGADRAAVHAPRRRPLRLGDRPVRRAARHRRDARAPLARVEPAPDRPRSLRRLRHPDVQRPARARAAGRARTGRARPRGRSRAQRAMGTRSRRPARRARHGGRGAPRARAGARRRSRPVPVVALAHLARLPHRRRGGARRRGGGRAPVPGAGAVRGRQRDDRAPRLVLRRRRPLSRHARRDARRGRAGRVALRARARPEPRDGGRDLARAHRLRVRALPALPARRSRPRGRPAGGGRGARPADRDAGAAGPGRRAGRAHRRPRCRTGSPHARRRSSGSWRRA